MYTPGLLWSCQNPHRHMLATAIGHGHRCLPSHTPDSAGNGRKAQLNSRETEQRTRTGKLYDQRRISKQSPPMLPLGPGFDALANLELRTSNNIMTLLPHHPLPIHASGSPRSAGMHTRDILMHSPISMAS